jgi:hypothetical protein
LDSVVTTLSSAILAIVRIVEMNYQENFHSPWYLAKAFIKTAVLVSENSI